MPAQPLAQPTGSGLAELQIRSRQEMITDDTGMKLAFISHCLDIVGYGSCVMLR